MQVSVDVHSPHAGVLTQTLAAEGSEVNVGQKLFLIAEGGKAPTSAAPVAASAPVAAPVKEQSSKPAEKPVAKEAPKAAPKSPAPPAPAKPAAGRTETRVKMSRMRQRIAQRLKEAQNTAAMLTTFQEVDMTHVIGLRAKYKDEFEKLQGVKLGFMGLFVKVFDTLFGI